MSARGPSLSPAESSPLAEATRRQSQASDPAVSAWVSANAGSGKTHVLARRVIRLLLNGTAPGRILCLTYTKAAAANMATRVLDILSRWVSLPDAELDRVIADTSGLSPTADLRTRARRLFAAALETPGGLKIQTIHAFCGALLHRFPFEAEVAAGFRELDDASKAEIIARIRADLIVSAAERPDSAIGRALARLMAETSDTGISAMLDAAIAARARIAHLDTDAARRAALAGALGLAPETAADAIAAQVLDSPHLPRSEWESVAATLSAIGKATDQKRAASLLAAVSAQDEAAARGALRDVFFNTKGEPRSDKDLATSAVSKAEPDLFFRLTAERDRLALLDAQMRGAEVLERTAAAFTLGAEACRRYAREKAVRGLLDFDDLVTVTADLLKRVPASFVHYKLDQGVDHVLVDEAQDTSPGQWEVVKGLTDDFFSGAGARANVTRTVFVVGDEKQSIFSFQGADPRTFGTLRTDFEQRARASGFRRVELPHSFRSAPGVLEAVDAVFTAADAARGLTLDDTAPAHAAIRADAPALVEIWPTVQPTPAPDVDDWRRPLDAVPADDPVNELARRVAGFIKAGIDQGLAIPARKGRLMQAGDVLILVRRRGKAFEAIIRALKDLNDPRVAVAGADRLVVADHIAALDLMALGDVMLSPHDDLALAALLKSPLFGFTDDDLMALCPGRAGRLLDALAASVEPRHRAAAERLAAWRGEALALRPFDFYARVLGRDGGRRAMLARLGPEAADVLDEFCALARTHEQNEAASLAGFLALMRSGAAETKRDMESGRNEVRVMTVHGAKGLEAPVVILADTVAVPRARAEGGFIAVPDGAGHAIPVLAPRKAEDPPGVAVARQAAADREMAEYRRLLYVALTRAEDALIVCGAETRAPAKDKPHARAPGCWYDLVHDALAPDATTGPALGFTGDVLRWRKGAGLAGTAQDAPAPAVPAVPAAPPLTPVPRQEPPRRLRPSGGAAGASGPAQTPAPGEVPALLRGDLVHRLLAGLPTVAETEQHDAGLRLLRHAAPDHEAAYADILAEVLGVLGHAPLADLFGPEGRPEVPIIGRLVAADGAPVAVNGRIDRLAVRPGRIILADFKTDRTPPSELADIGESYIGQMATYAALLERAFPGRAVEARLIYSRGPSVFVLPAAQLDAALARLLG